TLTKKASFHTPKSVSPKLLCVKHVCTILPSPPLVRESTFGFKPGTRNNQNIKSRHDAENPYPQSTPQVLPSFEEHTPPVTYLEEVKETLGIPIEVEPLDEPQLEDLGLNTCNHDITLSYKKIPSVDEPEPQLLLNSSSLDVILGDKRGTDLPINPCISGSFRKKVVDPLTINTPPSPHVAYYHPGFYAVLSLDLTNKIARRKFLIKNEKEFFTVPGDGIGIKPDGVASPVFSTWMTFRGNTRDLDSFEEETNKITDLQQIHKEVLFTVRGDGIACIKRCHRDLSSNGDRDLATASGRDRLKEDLESFT
ncbi:hypothetical protein Tco_1290156, partial [Tanacetum coccineum]